MRLRAASGNAIWQQSVGVYIHSVPSAAIPMSLVSDLLPVAAADGSSLHSSMSSMSSSISSSSSSRNVCCIIDRGGFVRYIGSPAAAREETVQHELTTLKHPSVYLGLSSGFEKYWLPALQIQVVEDDVIRSNTITLKEGALPLRFALDARAERGR